MFGVRAPVELSVLLVEDEGPLATAWSRYLEMMGVRVYAARTLRDAAAQLDAAQWKQRRYQVVLLDLNLPDGDGETLLPALERLRPAPRIAVLSGHLTSHRVVELAGSSVVGVPKPIESRTLFRLIQTLGEMGTGEETFRALYAHYKLSPKERQLLELAAAGYDNHEAARALACRRGTVTTYWHRIFKKTGLGSQREVLGHFTMHALRAARGDRQGEDERSGR